MRIQRRLYSYSKSRNRGSAIITSLVIVAILAIAVGVMLSSSARSVRYSRDKVMFEEAYQAAVSGTHLARAWIVNPDLAGTMSGSGTISTSLKDLLTKTRAMNAKIQEDVKAKKFTNLYGTTRFTNAGINLGTMLSDGRYVLAEFPTNNNRIVDFINDANNKQFSESLTKGAPSKLSNYVNMVRITTPGTTNETSASLRETTFIIESRGVTEYAGTKKERVVQQRLLIYPNEPAKPLLSAKEAILTQGSMTITGKSHANVHWGPVLAKGNLAIEFLDKVAVDNKGNWTLSTSNGDGKKYNGVNVYTEDPKFNTSNVTDEWLRWMAGTNGQLMGSDGTNLFGNITGTVTDFFAQVRNGAFAATPNSLTQSNFTLDGQFINKTLTDANNNGLYSYDTATGKATNGALVQGSAEVDTKVDAFFSDLSYSELKAYAKSHNGYYVWDGSKLTDAAGVTATMPDMVSQAAASGFDPLTGTIISDRILFIDSKLDMNSDVPNNPFSSKLALPSFWKGVMYVNGSVQSTGAGSSPNMVVRTPTQYTAFKAGVTASPATYEIKSVLMDGILICNGLADLGGNTSIYGTLAAKGGLGLGGTPSIFYNSANGDGRLKDDTASLADYRIIAGRLLEPSSN